MVSPMNSYLWLVFEVDEIFIVHCFGHHSCLPSFGRSFQIECQRNDLYFNYHYGRTDYLSYRWLFWRMEGNHSPNSHQKIWRTNGLRTGVLLGVISDMHMVHINLEDPMDVRNDLQQDTRPHAVSFSNFLIWVWGVISFHSSKKSPVKLPVEI